VVLPGVWLVSSIWFLLSTGQLVIGAWCNSLPLHARCSDLLFFLPGGSCVDLYLQLYLFSSSWSKVGQFSFEYCPHSHKTSSGIQNWPQFGRLACRPIPAVIFFSLHLLRILLFSPPHSVWHVQCSTPPLLSVLDWNLLFVLFSFVEGDSICAGLCKQGVGRGVMYGACWSPVCSAGLSKQLWKQLVGRNGVPLFSVQWGIERLSTN
jgi:hypothetical protein